MGSLYENIIALCNAKGIKGGKMCTDLGISKGTLTDLKMGRQLSLSAVKAQKIADYFGVSVGYLLGSETENAPTESGERDILDEVDIGFYNGFKELDEDQKETIRDMVRIMRQRRAEKGEI